MTIKKSPSMRREWIEMLHGNQSLTHSRRSPSMRREWIEICPKGEKHGDIQSLPPCGGSGLKFTRAARLSAYSQSPSMRREWIEILREVCRNERRRVSLHAEGVD